MSADRSPNPGSRGQARPPYARAQVHPLAAEHGAARRADPARALAPDGRGRCPTCAPRRPGRGAWIGVDRADARSGPGQGQAARRARPRVQDRRRSRFPTISASGSRRRCARRRSTGSGSKRAPATLLTGTEKIETARAQAAQVAPAAPRRRCRRGRQAQARPGLAGRPGGRQRPQGLVIPAERRHIVIGARAAKMWYMSP